MSGPSVIRRISDKSAKMGHWLGPARGAKATGRRLRALPLIGALTAALAWFLPGAALAGTASPTTARFPFGLYAHVDIETVLPELVKKRKNIQITQSATQACAVVTASSGELAELHDAFQSFYTTLLSDTAISGITAGVHWCRVQIEPPNSNCAAGPAPCLPDGNDWSYVDDIFTAVHNYNTTNKANKTIQLIVTPGVYSPSWLTDGSILKSCDPLFADVVPAGSLADCGMVTFDPYPEQRKALHSKDRLLLPMPLPWSSQYLHYWHGFVEDLAARYGQDQALVAVVIAGPTAATTEMILPSTDNTPNESFQCSPVAGNPTQCTKGPAADQAWQMLIQNSFQNSKKNQTYATYPAQVFVDYWERAIRMYEQIFADSNLALILTPDDYQNMPEFAGTSGLPSPKLGADFINFHTIDCGSTLSLPTSCLTKATVIFYLLNHSIPATAKGKITKGTSVGGMTARSPTVTGKIDVPGVKLVTANPSPFTANGVPLPGGPFIGGAEFDHALTTFDLTNNSYQPLTNAFSPVNTNFQGEACLSTQPNCVCPTPPNCVGYVSVEQGAFQVFTTFFYGTKAAYLFNAKAATTPPINFQAPVQWVDVEWQDVMYALSTAGRCALASTTTSTQFPGKILLQDVFNQANYGLQVIADVPNISQPALICGSSP